MQRIFLCGLVLLTVLVGADLRRVHKSESFAGANSVKVVANAKEGLIVHNRAFTVCFKPGVIEFLPKHGGPKWNWALSGSDEVLPTVTLDGKIAYERAEYREEYILEDNFIEQQFVVEQPPRMGTISIHGKIESEGIFSSFKEGWSWRNGSGEVLLGNVYAFDAKGRALKASMEVSEDGSVITMEEPDIEDASYPITIDPKISTVFKISDQGIPGSASYQAINPDVAYDPVNQNYVVVWEGSEAGDIEIYAQRVSPAGVNLGTPVQVSFMTGTPSNANFDAKEPSIAYNSARQEFFVVWTGDDGSDDDFEIYGARLRASDLAIQLGEIKLSTSGAVGTFTLIAQSPDVVCTGASDDYLVVWSGSPVTAGKFEIFGQLVNGDGSEDGVDMQLSDMGPSIDPAYGGFTPRVAFNPAGQYLIVWSGIDNIVPLVAGEYEIFGQLLTTTGTPVSPNDRRLTFMGTDGNTLYGAFDPAIVFNAANNQYFLTWDGDDNTAPLVNDESEIFGQHLTSAGAPTGSRKRVSDMGPDSNGAYDAFFPDVSLNTHLNQYLITWYGDDVTDGETEVYSQILDAATLNDVGLDTKLSHAGITDGNVNFDAELNATAYDPNMRHHIVVWHMDDDTPPYVNNEFEVYGVTYAEPAPDPAGQPINPLLTAITTSSLTVSYSAPLSGPPDGYIVLRKANSSPTDIPLDQTTYSVGNTIGTSTVAFVGNALTFGETTLASGTSYFYDFFSYNGASASINYLTASPLEGGATTLSLEPTAHAASFTATQASPSQINLAFSAASTITNAAGYIILRRQDGSNPTATGIADGAAAPSTPVSGTTLVTTITSTATTTYNDNGLSPGFQYNYAIIPYGYNGSNPLSYNFRTVATVPTANAFTLSLEPTAHAASFTATPSGTSQINLAFSAASTLTNAAGYIILRRQDGANPSSTGIVDGAAAPSTPTAGTTLLTTITNTATVAFNDVTASPGTQYNYALIPYGYNGSNAQTYNFRTAATIPVANATTLSLEPTAHAASFTATTGGSNQINLTFSAASTITNASGYIILRRQDLSNPTSTGIVDAAAAPATPVAGTTLVTTITSTASTAFNDTGVSPGIQYNYAIIPYGYNGTNALTYNFRTAATIPTANAFTLSLEPVAHAATFTATQAGTSQINLAFAAASTITNAAGYIILRRQDGANPTATGIVDGAVAPSTPTTGTTLLTTITSTATIAYNDVTASPGTQYNYALIPYGYNGSNAQTYNFRTAATIPVANATTLSLEPVAHALSFTATTGGSNQINLTFSAASTITNAAGYIILRRQDLSNPTSTGIVDAAVAPATPVAGTTLVTTITSAASTAFNDTGVSPGIQYNYAIIPYGYNGTNALTYNFRTAATIPTANAFSLSLEPAAHAATFTATQAGTSQINLTFSAASTITNAAGYIILRRQDGTNPTATGIVDGAAAPSTPTAGTTLLTTITSTATVTFNDVTVGTGTQYNYAIIPYGYNGSNAQTYNFRTAATIPVSNAATLSLEPAGHAALFTATQAGSSQINLAFSAANSITNATGYIILRRQDATNPTSAGITDGAATPSTPAAGTTLVTTITNTATTAFNDLGLTSGIQYNYSIIPYGYNGTNSQTYNYRTATTIPTSNAITLVVEPTAQPTLLSFNTITSNSMQGTFTAASGTPAGYLVIRKAGSSPTDVPSDGSTYVVGNLLGASTIVAFGSGTTFSSTGLTATTVYYYDIFSYNGSSGTYNYLLTTPLEGSQTSLATEPANQPTLPVFSNHSVSSYSLDFTAATGSPDGYIVVRKQGSAPTGAPTDGTAYSLGNAIVDGTVVSVGSSLSVSEAGLSAGNAYYYKVFSFNGSGASLNYQTTSPLQGNTITLCSSPVFNAVTTVNQTSMVLSWPAVFGVASYALEISSDNFSSFFGAYSPKAIATGPDPLNENVSGLNPGTIYQFRVRAVNASGSSANGTGQKITVPATPTIDLPQAIGQFGFNLSWNAVTGADKYFLDVSTSPAFSSFVSGFQGLEITSASATVSGLSPGVIYYSRVRSNNTSGTSPNSGANTQATLPATPVPFSVDAADISATSFKAKWAAATGADSYEIDVSTDDFATTLTGYTQRPVTNGIEETVIGLLPNTLYKFRVRSKSAVGYSPFSLVVTAQTKDGQTPGTSFKINTAAGTFTHTNGTTSREFVVNISGGTGTRTVTMQYRKITGTFKTATATVKSGDDFAVTLNESDFDELGLEYYFEATDATGAIATPNVDHSFLFRTINTSSPPSIPNLPAGSDLSNYRIISIPYLLEDNLVQSIFGALGQTDASKWRLVHYQNGKNVDYLSFNSVVHGHGYWYISRTLVDIKLGAGSAPKFHQGSPFKLNLTKGWNQIGAPYPFDVDWDDVQLANPGKAVGKLNVFNPSGVTLGESNSLKAWSGGFVFADNDISDFTFPVVLKNTAGGRMAGVNTIQSSELDSPEWMVGLVLQQGKSENSSIGVGMHPQASESKDVFDAISVPRFFKYLEMSTNHQEFFAPLFTRDVVPTQRSYTWKFTVSSNLDEPGASLHWNPALFGNNDARLVLFDESAQAFVDMRSVDKYSFDIASDRTFRILYTANGKDWSPGFTQLARPYPNPSAGKATIPLIMTEETQVSVEIYDLSGKKIKTLLNESVASGLSELTWHGDDDGGQAVAQGMYLIQMRAENSFRQVQKIIIR